MPIYQAWNPRNKRWVKYHFTKEKGFKPTGMKKTKYKGLKVKGKSK